MKQLFTKTFYSPQQHIVLLKNRGLLIADEEKAAGYIYNIGYFRLSAYFYPLLKFPKEQHLYKPGGNFRAGVEHVSFRPQTKVVAL